MRRFLSKSIDLFIPVFAILGGIAFFVIQSSKLLSPGSTEIKILMLPLERFNWGFIWSDTLVAGPFLLSGGILMFIRNYPSRQLGRLFVFAGFAINLYAMILLWIGLTAIGRPMQGTELWMNIFLTLLGVLCMVRLGLGETFRLSR